MSDLTALRELNERRTKGEWVVWSEEGQTSSGEYKTSVCQHSGGLESADHTCLCDVRGKSAEQSEANARLLSLATELYPLAEALNAMIDQVTHHTPTQTIGKATRMLFPSKEKAEEYDKARALLDALMAKVKE